MKSLCVDGDVVQWLSKERGGRDGRGKKSQRHGNVVMSHLLHL